jgi:hypothetical protein
MAQLLIVGDLSIGIEVKFGFKVKIGEFLPSWHFRDLWLVHLMRFETSEAEMILCLVLRSTVNIKSNLPSPSPWDNLHHVILVPHPSRPILIIRRPVKLYDELALSQLFRYLYERGPSFWKALSILDGVESVGI